jgi:hypothetical protein
VSFAAITLCVASQRVFVVYFVIHSVRNLLDTPSYETRTAHVPEVGRSRTQRRSQHGIKFDDTTDLKGTWIAW